jgi:predicted MPP superfamily phosphohydrolase
MVRLGSRRYPALRNWQLVGRRPALFALVLVAIASTWAFFEARQIEIEKVKLTVPQLPAGMPRLRIVQISDLHLGLINREWLLEEVVTRAEQLHPDLVVVTGDLLDAQRNHLDDLIAPWRQLVASMGKFAVVGNHEAYAGRTNSLEFLRNAGFRVLINELVTINGIQIAGVTDPAWGERQADIDTLSAGKPGDVTILLKHRPWAEAAAIDRFTLQLSGHAHRGQIFPFNILTGFAYPRQDGLYRLGASSWLYTSRGTGSWGPPMRLFSPPELTLIELVAENTP